MVEVRRDFVAVLDESVRRFSTSPPTVQAREALRPVASDLESCVKGTVSTQMRKRLYEWFEGWAALEAEKRSVRRVVFSDRDSPGAYLSRLIGEELVRSERADAGDVATAVLARIDSAAHELLLGYFLQGEVSQISNEHLRAAINAVPRGVPDDDQIRDAANVDTSSSGTLSGSVDDGEDDANDHDVIESYRGAAVGIVPPDDDVNDLGSDQPSFESHVTAVAAKHVERNVGGQQVNETHPRSAANVPSAGPSVSMTARLGKASGGQVPEWHRRLMAQRLVGVRRRWYGKSTYDDLSRAIDNRERTGSSAYRWADKYRATQKALVESGAQTVDMIPIEILQRALDEVQGRVA